MTATWFVSTDCENGKDFDMTHASDLAKLAETFIDRYLVECDARREAEAALAKSEEERATQSASLAAALAEVEKIRSELLTVSVNGDRGWQLAEERFAEIKRARGIIDGAKVSIANLESRLAALQAEVDALTGELGRSEASVQAMADTARSERDYAASMRAEDDEVRRDCATRVACEVTNVRADERRAWQEATGYSTPAECCDAKLNHRAQRADLATCDEGEGVLTAARRVVKERDEWRAKAEDRLRHVTAWQSATGCATPDEAKAKAAGEGRVVGEPVWTRIDHGEMLATHEATVGRLTLVVTEGREAPSDDPMGGRLPEHEVFGPAAMGVGRCRLSQSFWRTVDDAKAAAVSFALSLNGATLAQPVVAVTEEMLKEAMFLAWPNVYGGDRTGPEGR